MRFITSFVTLSLGLHLSAQPFPFPDSSASWAQYFETMVSPPPVPTFQWQSTANFCIDGSDTLIAGTSFTRLSNCSGGYVGGIRSVNEAVHFHPADSTQEYLLYDLGAAVGDTLFGVYVDELLATGSEGWMGRRLIDVVVLSKAPNSTYGGRIVMQVQAIDPGIGLDSEWIEGIGCIHGLFTFSPLNVSQYWYGLHCMSHNDTTYWNGAYTETPGSCAPITMGMHETAGTVLDVTMYPNPTSGVVYLQGLDSNDGIQVRDALGRLVLLPSTRISSDAVLFDLSARPSGLYQISTAKGQLVGRVLRE